MKSTAYLINIGRGVIVDLADLTRALQEGRIAGAGLDVFETEAAARRPPALGPAGRRHHAAHRRQRPRAHERRLQVLLENTRRFVAGELLVNVVDKQQWF